MDVEKTAVLIRDAVRDLPNRFHENNRRINELEDEQNDLLHYVELTRFNAYQGFEISKRIQEIRQERRKLKNENEQLKHLQQILSKWRDRLKHLDQAVGDIRKAKINMENRGYRCRVRKDLEDKINGVKK